MNKTAFDIVYENFEKTAKSKENDELKTKFWKDRFGPELKRSLIGAGAGLGVGLATKSPLKGTAAMGVTSMYLSDKALRDKSQDLLNRKATGGERAYNAIKQFGAGALAQKGASIPSFALQLNTPESQVKRRARAKRDGMDDKGVYFFNDKKREKTAFEIIEESFEKISY